MLMRLLQAARLLPRDRSGAVIIEYAILLGILAFGIFAAMSGVAGETVGIWNSISDQVTSASSG